MKPLKLLLVTLLFTVLAMQQISADTCCASITFNSSGEPINAQSEKYYEYMNHYCGGDCPTTGSGGWGGPPKN